MDESVDLCRVFLASQIKSNGLLQVGDIADRPTCRVLLELCARVQVNPAFLPISDDLALGTVNDDRCRHLARPLSATGRRLRTGWNGWWRRQDVRPARWPF